MFEVGFSELLLIMALALIVLGPEKLPKVASQVGRWMGRARSMARQFRETLEEEVKFEETRTSQTGANRTPGAAAASGSSAAVAGGLAASAGSEPPEPVFDTSNIPYADVPQSPSYDTGSYDTGHGGGGAQAGDGSYAAGSASDSDADTRHNDYAGAAYEPPVAPSAGAPAEPAPPADADAQSHVQRGT